MPARQCLAYSRDQRHQQGPGLPFQERAACGRDLGQASPRPAGRRSFPLALGGPVPEPLPGRPPPWTDQPRAWLLPPEAPSPPSQPALQPPHPQATPSQPPLGCACPVLALWAQPVPRVALRERPGAAPSSAGRWGLWEPGRDEPGGCTRAELGARYPGRAAPLRGAASWAGPCAPGPARRSARPSAERSCWSSAGRRPRSGTPLPAQPHEAFMELGKKLALVRQGQGEKYVGLKRRSQGAAPGPPAGMALWEAPQAGPEEEAALPHILVTDFSASSTAAWGSLEGVPATAPDPQPESEPPRAAEEDAESVSKPRAPPSLPLPLLSRQPESEQDASEDGGSSLGSSSVADFTSGFTALHWAAKHGKEDLVSLLVAAGADVNTRSLPMLGPSTAATPHYTLLLCTDTARSWTCSSAATVPSRTCGITVGTWPDTTWEQRSRWTETPRCPSCQQCAAGTGRWPVCSCPRAAARPGSAGALPRT
nr:proline-rich protein 2-like isoform X24 [Chrysemys picta bellii]